MQAKELSQNRQSPLKPEESMLALTAGPQQLSLPGKVEEQKVETLALSRQLFSHFAFLGSRCCLACLG